MILAAPADTLLPVCPLAGTLDVLDIFNGRDAFKMHVQEKVEKVPIRLSYQALRVPA